MRLCTFVKHFLTTNQLLMEGRLEKVVKEIEALNTFLQQGH